VEPNLNTGQTPPVSAPLPPTAAENYRESGLVPWHDPVIP